MSDDFDKDLSWLDDDSDDNGDESDDLTFDWMKDEDDEGAPGGDSERTGVTGQLTWRRERGTPGNDIFPEVDDDAFPEFDWEAEDGGTTGGSERTGVTGELDWQKAQQSQMDEFERHLDEAERAAQEVERAANELESEAEDIFPEAGDILDEADEALPDWLDEDDERLSKQEAPTIESRPTSGGRGLLDMLEDAGSDDEPFEMTSSHIDEDVPDWLAGLDDADEDETAAPVQAVPTSEDDDDALDWLTGLDDDEDDDLPPEMAFGAEEDASLPDWLTGDDETDADDAPSGIAEMSADDDLSDWLAGLDADEADSDSTPAAIFIDDADEAPTSEAEFDSADSGVPDWLAGLDEDEEAEATPAKADPLASLFETDDDEEEFDLDGLVGASSPVSDFDDFSEEEFAADTGELEDMFSMFSDADSGPSGLTGILGNVDEDLLGGADDVDLLGQLSGTDETPETPIADSVAEDDAFITQAQAKGYGTDDAPDEEATDPFRDAFFGASPDESAIDEGDMDWLAGIEADDLEDEPELDDLLLDDGGLFESFADDEPQYDSVEDYLASLDDDVELPKTGELSLMGGDVDLDTLFGEDGLLPDVEDDEHASIELSPDAPDWLSDLTQEAAGDKSAAALARQRKDRPVEELDDRLKELRQRGLDLNVRNVTGDTPSIERIIPGVSNTLPAVVFDPGDVEVLTDVMLTEEQSKNAALLRGLTGEPDESETDKKRRRLPRLISERLIIGVILVVAMALPFLNSGLNIGDQPPAQFVPGSVGMGFFDAIDAVNEGDFVLVAAEFGSAGAAELDVATDALLRHILARGGTPIIVSGNAVGLLRVESLIENIANQNNLTRNTDYVVGSYLVADVVGLRNFAQNIGRYVSIDSRGQNTGLSLDSLDAFGLIVVIAENADRVRVWGEQVAPLTTAPLTAITGQSAAPLAAPYLEVGGVDGIAGFIVGYQDGQTYQRMVARLINAGGMVDFSIIPTATLTPTPPPATSTPIPPTAVPTEILAEITEEAPMPDDRTATTTPPADATDDEVSATIAPSDTPMPTETPEPPTATSTPTTQPTATHTPTFTPTPTPTPVRFAVVTADGAVNVRPDASTSGSPVGVLQSGGRALVLDEETNDLDELWFNVRFFNVSGLLIEGWLRSDLVSVEESDDDPTEFIPTVTPESAQNAAFGKRHITGGQADDAEPTLSPQEEIIITLTAVQIELEQAEAEVDQAIMATVGRPLVRDIVPPEIDDDHTRWFSMTWGLVAAVLLITGGSLYNVIRSLSRRRKEK